MGVPIGGWWDLREEGGREAAVTVIEDAAGGHPNSLCLNHAQLGQQRDCCQQSGQLFTLTSCHNGLQT